MTDQQMKDAIHGFMKSWTSGDIKKALIYFAPDAVWISPNGTFKGMEQIEKNLNWTKNLVKNFQINETGLGIITKDDKAVIEHDISGNVNDKPVVMPSMCVYEFKNDKVANIRTYFDRLSEAQQVATGLAKTAVNAVVGGVQKGL